jgi:hypothetical protein
LFISHSSHHSSSPFSVTLEQLHMSQGHGKDSAIAGCFPFLDW